MKTPSDKPNRRWRLPRWSMATMFIGVTLVCVVVGLVIVPGLRIRAYQAKWAELGATVNHGVLLDEEVTEFRIIDSQLNELPSEIGNLTNLTMLDLSHSKNITVSSEIEKLTKLTFLSLHACKRTVLPHEIVKLTNLTDLDLSYNQLTSLPTEIGNLTSLAVLDLRENPITDADLEHLKSLHNLGRLGLKGTKVTKEGVTNLQRSLSNCRIDSDYHPP